jgi:hypothetical protein
MVQLALELSSARKRLEMNRMKNPSFYATPLGIVLAALQMYGEKDVLDDVLCFTAITEDSPCDRVDHVTIPVKEQRKAF